MERFGEEKRDSGAPVPLCDASLGLVCDDKDDDAPAGCGSSFPVPDAVCDDAPGSALGALVSAWSTSADAFTAVAVVGVTASVAVAAGSDGGASSTAGAALLCPCAVWRVVVAVVVDARLALPALPPRLAWLGCIALQWQNDCDRGDGDVAVA